MFTVKKVSGICRGRSRRSRRCRAIPAIVLILFAGCAAKQPIDLTKPHLAIPISCIDKVLAGTDVSLCETIPGKPDWANCNHVIVHFTCTKVSR